MGTPPRLAGLLDATVPRDRPGPVHPTDERIMDAVVKELCVVPLARVTLDGVAARAGLTRTTVYRRFGSRDRLLDATIAREVARFLAAVAEADDPGAPPAERVASSFATALTLAHAHPVVAHMLATDPGEAFDTLAADDGFVVRAGSAFVATHLAEGDPRHPHPDPVRTGEVLARLFVALVLLPPLSVDLTDAEQARRLARDVVVPIIAGVRGGPGGSTA